MEEHRHFLWRTLELAERAAAQVAPNPMVGALIVRAGELIATGYHEYYGGPHAEAVALDQAGTAARGATLYCNLEPCSYRCAHKHQPPCTEAIIRAGIARVVIGQLDPNPRVSGAGVRALEQAGITVELAAEQDQESFWRFNAAFNSAMAFRRPHVHAKVALSLDGRIATRSGDSRWISNAAARSEVHELRARSQAVMVGVNTVVADNPRLTVRDAPWHQQPRAVVIDPSLRIPRDSLLVRERAHELIVCCRADAISGVRSGLVEDLERRGVTVVPVASADAAADADSAGGLPPQAVLAALFDLEIRSILLEGGAHTLTAFVRAGLVDQLTAYIAPLIIGTGVAMVGNLFTQEVAGAPRFEAVAWRTLDDQAVFEGFRAGWWRAVRAVTEERLCLPA